MFVQCRVEEDSDGHDAMTWSNLSPEEAADLHRDLAVGIQHVGELLRVRGLW